MILEEKTIKQIIGGACIAILMAVGVWVAGAIMDISTNNDRAKAEEVMECINKTNNESYCLELFY